MSEKKSSIKTEDLSPVQAGASRPASAADASREGIRFLALKPAWGGPELFLSPLFVALQALAILCLVLGLPAFAAIFCCLGNTFAPWHFPWKWRLRSISTAFVLTATLNQALVNTLSDTQSAWAQRVEKDGPAALSLPECAGIYIFGLAMGLGGYVAGYPDAANEHLGLYRLNDTGITVTSDFPMQSPKIRKVLDDFAKTLPKVPGAGEQKLAKRRVNFRMGEDSRAIFYALNPLDLSATAKPEGTGYLVYARGDVNVSYPPKAKTPLFSVSPRFGRGGATTLFAEEGLFWALQERGWLKPYPYTRVWRYNVAR